MAGIVARLCERTAGRRVPALGPGPGGLLHYTTHCVVVTALGAELRGFAEHTGRAVHRRVRSCDEQEHTPLRQGRERAEHPHGWQRRGAGELCEPLGKWGGKTSNLTISLGTHSNVHWTVWRHQASIVNLKKLWLLNVRHAAVCDLHIST